ncbi:MAG: BMP family ABC transporter substrate-binding protein [Clostridia bacterium]|nr:BMP family ABC transporter substrate-binding protein [Clostridia bacterium]
MKKSIYICILFVVMCFVIGCTKKEENSASTNKKKTETKKEEKQIIAYVTDYESIDDKFYKGAIWKGIKTFAKQQNYLKKKYSAKTENNKDSKIKAVEKAVSEGADIIVFPDSSYAEIIGELQYQYSDIDMLLVDFEPIDAKGNVNASKNVATVGFKEEEAAYMTGFVAVAEGYRRVGFYGAMKDKSTNDYGYGFIQGLSDAAKKLKLSSYSIKLEFRYVGGYSPADAIVADAKKSYETGTEVIYCCSGDAINSIVKATERITRRKIIGCVDEDVNLSNNVIFSSLIDVEKVIKETLDEYVFDGNRWGMAYAGNVIEYGMKNDVISLSASEGSWRMKNISENKYEVFYNNLLNSNITIYGNIVPTTSYVSINMKDVNRKVYKK